MPRPSPVPRLCSSQSISRERGPLSPRKICLFFPFRLVETPRSLQLQMTACSERFRHRTYHSLTTRYAGCGHSCVLRLLLECGLPESRDVLTSFPSRRCLAPRLCPWPLWGKGGFHELWPRPELPGCFLWGLPQKLQGQHQRARTSSRGLSKEEPRVQCMQPRPPARRALTCSSR